MKETKETKKTKKAESKGAVVSNAVGRRKRAVARVFIRRGKGSLVINGRDHKTYFDTDFTRDIAYFPFSAMKIANYDAEVNVYGGGIHSQADAIKLAIARALVAHDPEVRTELRKWRLLTVDSRVKERKKYGQRGARAKFQFTKR